MKVTNEHFGLLKYRIDSVINEIGIDKVKEHRSKNLGKDIDKRFRWDLYHASHCYDILKLKSYSDKHIDTALKTYIKTREELSWL